MTPATTVPSPAIRTGTTNVTHENESGVKRKKNLKGKEPKSEKEKPR